MINDIIYILQLYIYNFLIYIVYILELFFTMQTYSFIPAYEPRIFECLNA